MSRATIAFGSLGDLHSLSMEPMPPGIVRLEFRAGNTILAGDLDRERAYQLMAALLVFMDALWPLEPPPFIEAPAKVLPS